MCSTTQTSANFFFKQKTAYEILAWLEFRRVLFRSGAGRLINVMEDLGLGTKATRPNIIQNLYDRGYVHDDPLVPTEKGMAVAQALKDFASEIASHEMTAELERSMDAKIGRASCRERV